MGESPSGMLRAVVSSALRRQPVVQTVRYVSSAGRGLTSTKGTAQEEHIREKLEGELDTEFAQVKDISGGCGSMFEIYVASDDFKGLTLVKQHKLVKGLLADEIAEMHGVTLKT